MLIRRVGAERQFPQRATIEVRMLPRVLPRDAVDLRQRHAVKAQVAFQVRLVEFGARRLAGRTKAAIEFG